MNLKAFIFCTFSAAVLLLGGCASKPTNASGLEFPPIEYAP